MTPDSSTDFFADLPAFSSFGEVADLSHYHPAPESWRVVVTDVKGSTRAIEAGRYKDVNTLGACSIVATLNAVGDVDIPYVFGGDGATLLVPPDVVEPVAAALGGLARMADELFDLELRVGIVPVADIVERGGQVLVARYRASKDISLAMLTGRGAELAEKLVKDESLGDLYQVEAARRGSDASLEGFQCRWNPIRNRNGQILNVLVTALADDPSARHATYARILAHFEQLGSDERLHPLSRDTLDIAADPAAMENEARVRTGKRSGLGVQAYKLKTALQTRVGRKLIETGKRIGDFDGARYPGEVIANADFRKFDDALRMVVDVSAAQRDAIETFLADERARGAIAYGLHASDSALMTCLVFDYRGDHIHFVDGADGGYAMAARQLKQQLAQPAPQPPRTNS